MPLIEDNTCTLECTFEHHSAACLARRAEGELVARVYEMPTVYVEVRRRGKLKKEGGEGITWTCGCGTFGRMRCIHQVALHDGKVTESWENFDVTARFMQHDRSNMPRFYVELTALGDSLLRERWAVLALKRTNRTSEPW